MPVRLLFIEGAPARECVGGPFFRRNSIMDGFDYPEQTSQEDSERWRDGRCQSCGGKLLVGATDAEFAYGTGKIRRICFWCFEAGEWDPSDPQPSQFSYGHC
jgi:hypothetical protein